MPPPLPAKSAPVTPANITALHAGLTSVIAGHPGSVEPWTFYEVLDDYLGPWRDAGYPIAYGKHYCIAFNGNDKLNANATTREWVRKTTVALQEPLRDFVVDRFRAGTLASLTEPELRAFAFGVHPKAYVAGGLTMVVLVAPELLDIIATIPAAEFSPNSQNFAATWSQVERTIELVVPQAAGMTLAGLAGPAHTGLFARAAAQDARRFQNEMNAGRSLDQLQRRLERGELDNFRALDIVAARLNATQYDDQGLARRAREVLAGVDARRHAVARYYRRLVQTNTSLGRALDTSAPGWRNW